MNCIFHMRLKIVLDFDKSGFKYRCSYGWPFFSPCKISTLQVSLLPFSADQTK